MPDITKTEENLELFTKMMQKVQAAEAMQTPRPGEEFTRPQRDLMKAALASPQPYKMRKDANSTFSQSTSPTTGITEYNLEAPALSLYPLNTPLRNFIPRKGGGTGTAVNWRAVRAINTNGTDPGIAPGHRGGVINVTVNSLTAAYKGLGHEVNTDWEAQFAAKGFDDARALATLSGLRSLMLSEELVILGGNTSQSLGTTPTPSATDAGGGTGVLVNNTSYSIICVALTLLGVRYGSVAGGVQGAIVRTNADGTSDTFGGRSAKVSANLLHTTGNSPATATYTITASLAAPVLGAAGYAWFIATTAGLERLVAITSAPTVAIGALPAGTNQLASTLGTNDNSTNAYLFDGLIYQAIAANSGAYVQAISATLTADGAGGIVEFDTALKSMWDTNQLGPTDCWLNSQQALDVGKKILNANSANVGQIRFVVETDPAKLAGGYAVATYRNKFAMDGAQTITLHLHPNMPAGMVLFTAKTIPYPMDGVASVIEMDCRQEYNQVDWPPRTRMYESGVYVDEVLKIYAPFSMALLYDVRAG
jgi:hypothetical protein